MEHESVSGELEIDLYAELTAFSSQSPEQQEAEVERIVVGPSGPLITEPELDPINAGQDEGPITIGHPSDASFVSDDTLTDGDFPFDEPVSSAQGDLFNNRALSAEENIFEEPLYSNEIYTRPDSSGNGDLYPESRFAEADIVHPETRSISATTDSLSDNLWNNSPVPVQFHSNPEPASLPTQASRIVPTAGPGEAICVTCGATSNADDLLCIDCGAFLGEIGTEATVAAAPEPEPAVPVIPVCSDCGSEVTLDELFCPSCGTVL